MSKFTKNIVALIILGIMVYVFRGELSYVLSLFKDKYLPCTNTIKYSLGVIDKEFNLTDTEVLSALGQAENIWEKSYGKELFTYSQTGPLKVNFIYDTRQEVTRKLQSLGVVVDNSKSSYDGIKDKYTILKLEYEKLKSVFDTRLKDFEVRRALYESNVNYWNAKGGANIKNYEALKKEESYLQTEALELATMQDELNFKIDDLNTLANTLNKVAQSINLNVEEFNQTATVHSGEFEEGTYEKSVDGEKINIYQFDNKTKLVRVLAHELGHALGLPHIEDPKAIMYYLNNGINAELTQSDLDMLVSKCNP